MSNEELEAHMTELEQRLRNGKVESIKNKNKNRKKCKQSKHKSQKLIRKQNYNDSDNSCSDDSDKKKNSENKESNNNDDNDDNDDDDDDDLTQQLLTQFNQLLEGDSDVLHDHDNNNNINSEDSSKNVYCVCRKPCNVDKLMICCDKCQEWCVICIVFFWFCLLFYLRFECEKIFILFVFNCCFCFLGITLIVLV